MLYDLFFVFPMRRWRLGSVSLGGSKLNRYCIIQRKRDNKTNARSEPEGSTSDMQGAEKKSSKSGDFGHVDLQK